MIPRLALLITVMCGLLLAPASAQRKQPAVGVIPPQPVQLNLKVRREGKTEIPLSIHGLAGEPLKFLIRTPPVQGRLSEPRQTGRETAAVVYEPPADLSITADRFFYAAQSAAGVSAPVEVLLTIVDQPPQLTIPDTLDFPPVRTGDTNTKLLEITNRGGGLAIGEVIVEAPWRIEGKTGYRLAAGDVAIYKLVFAPAVGGTFERVARFTSDPAHSTTLRGTGETSVTASPAEVVLLQIPGDPVRTGSLELTNQTDEPRNLQFKTDERLQLPAQVNLPPRGRMSVPIQMAAGDVRPLQTEIRIVAPDLELRVSVKAAAPGAVLRAVQRAIVFGQIPQKPPTSARFELENIGGATGEIEWTIGAPFQTRQNSTLLLPGERRAFDLEIDGKAPGKYRAWLQFKAGTQTWDIPVEAEIVTGTRPLAAGTGSPRSPASTTGSPPSDSTETPNPPAPPQLPRAPAHPAVPVDWFGDRQLPKGVTVTATSPTSATLEWPVGLSPASRFRVELRQLYYTADHNLAVTWLGLEGVEITLQGSNFAATIRDLEPQQPWTVRVVPLKADGTPDPHLFTIDFKTPPKGSHSLHVSPLRGMLIALGLLLAWQGVSWWRSRSAPR